MKRYVLVLALACALVLAVGVGSAAAGSLLPTPTPWPSDPGSGQTATQDQTVKNETDQTNKAFVISPTVAALNNVALISEGDQTTVAGTSVSQGNANSTDQTAVQVADQDQNAGSGQGGQEWKSGPSSSGASQHSDQDQTVKNETDQTNKAFVISPTVAALNNVALISEGDQTTVAGTSVSQGNANSTDQTAVQVADQDQNAGSGQGGQEWKSGPSSSGASQHSDQDQTVKNETDQTNKAFVISPTVAALNNVALISEGDQTTVAGTSVSQGNVNWTDQKAVQKASQDGGSAPSHPKYDKGDYGKANEACRCDGGKQSDSLPQQVDQDQTVRNETSQKNEAFVFSPTVVALNNLALISKGDQTTVAGTSVRQGNVNWTDQKAVQKASQDQNGGSAPSRRYDEKGDRKDEGRCHEQPSPMSYEKQGTYRGKDECRPKDEQHSAPGQHVDQEQTVKNETSQKNWAFVFSPTLAAGNNLALISKGDQTTVAGTSVRQGNVNWTDQKAVQKASQNGGSAPSRPYGDKGHRKNEDRCHEQPSPMSYEKGKDECRPKDEQHSAPGQHVDQEQTVKNETYQNNEAFVFSPTVAALNNLALISKGDQTTVAGTSVSQWNWNETEQKAFQGAFQRS